MSQVSRQALFKGILGASAVSLTFGAVQFASGRDLGSLSQGPVSQIALASAAVGIDRTAKGDRAAGVSVSAGRTQTISLRLEGLSDTSVLVSVPVAHAARDTSFGQTGRSEGGMRAGGQRVDRGRQAASAGPLRDLKPVFCRLRASQGGQRICKVRRLISNNSRNYSAGASSLDWPRLARNPSANPPTARIGISLLMPIARTI